MSNDNKTLADVRPGARVRLGDRPKDGEVLVEVSGLTGSGKSAIAGEIEILCKALGLDAEWVNGDEEKRLTHADWIGALEMYKPKVVIVEQNIPRAVLSAQPSPGGQGDALTPAMVGAAASVLARWAGHDDGSRWVHEARDALEAALAARQPSKQPDSVALGEATEFCSEKGDRKPVGEPASKSVGIDALVKLLEDEAAECEKAWTERADTYMSGRASGFRLAADYFRKIATNQRWSEFLSSPAQAVDHEVTDAMVDKAWNRFEVALHADDGDTLEDRVLSETIDQRDRYHELADELAGHIAAITGVDIGEHSSANCPWQNAIEAAEEYKPAQAVDLGPVRAALDAADALAVVCASVDGYSREEVAASGRAMRQQFTDALALIDSQAVVNG